MRPLVFLFDAGERQDDANKQLNEDDDHGESDEASAVQQIIHRTGEKKKNERKEKGRPAGRRENDFYGNGEESVHAGQCELVAFVFSF